MSDSKKSFGDKLQEKSRIAKDVMARGAQVVAEGAQRGGAAVAQGAQVVADGAQKGGAALAQGAHKGGEALAQGTRKGGEALAQGTRKGADALAQGAEKGGRAIAQGARIAADGTKKGAQFVKEHPKETAVIAGAAVVAAGALPFTPFTVPAALAVVGAAAQGAKATQDAFKNCSPDETGEDGHGSGTLGLIAAVEAGATVAETTMRKLDDAKPHKK